MKKIIRIFLLMIIVCTMSNKTFAQERTKIADGVYVVSYGNVNVIEDDNQQMTYEIKVKKTSDELYEVFCNNKFVKRVAKGGLTLAIKTALTAFTGIGGAVPSLVIGAAVDTIYDNVCDYYKD